jgi:peptidoglycan/LPS O-acetylase OafA/YrhL
MTHTRIAFAHFLRGLAAAAVVVSHLGYLIWRSPEMIGSLIAYPGLADIIRAVDFTPVTDFGIAYFWGHFGVALFFLISGFVIPFSVSTMSRRGFAIARILRIWPTYLFGLALAVGCIALNAASAGRPFPYSAGQILLNALIVTRWPTLTPSIDGIIWTLEVELFFYATCLVFMDQIRTCDRRLFLTALGVIPLAYLIPLGSGIILRAGMPIYAIAFWASTVPVYVCFMFCGTAFYFHYKGRLSLPGLCMTQLLLLLCFIVSLQIGFLATPDWSAPVAYVAAFVVFGLCFLMRESFSILPDWVRWPFAVLADVSYPLYAVHGVFGYTILVRALAAGMSAWVAVGVAAAAVFTVATAVHFLIELPSQAYGKTLAAKIGPRTAAAGPAIAN